MTERKVVANFILEARKGKGKGKKGGGDAAKRSRFLGVVMKHLSSDRGKAMANAIEAKDLPQFRDLWSKATDAIMSSLEEKFGTTKGNTETQPKPQDGTTNDAANTK